MKRRAVMRGLLAAVICGGVTLCAADETNSAAKSASASEAAQDDDLSAEEQEVLDAANAERAKSKLAALKSSSALMKVARAHATNMAKQKVLVHTLDEKSFSKRIDEAGYTFWSAGENIALGQKTGKEAVADWMTSPGHKANILSKDYTEIGIGRAVSKDGETYWVQVFARPQTEKPPVKVEKPAATTAK